MSIVTKYLIVIFFAYLLGSSSMSFYLSKMKGVNLREKGSKNLGASNAMVLMGWKAGILVAIHDAGKALLAVILARLFFPDSLYIGAVAGVAAVFGHIFPFYLRFKGGKGFASFMGMALALNWKAGLVLIFVVAAVTLITDYILVGTMTSIISFPTYMGFSSHNYILALILLIATAIIVFKHRDNLVRIYNGTEFRFRKANKGEYR